MIDGALTNPKKNAGAVRHGINLALCNYQEGSRTITKLPKEVSMFSKFHSRQKGFTLIELMIVVVIIGILAALAVPRFMRAGTKSKQSECKQILKQIYTMERTYRQEFSSYWGQGTTAHAGAPNAFATIGVEIAPTARYTYTITTADASTLLVTATCGILDDDAAVDTWTMDQNGNLVVTSDDAVI
jgi:prepilin-type N-terminal cleavage/methylation domain-containing protein